MGKDKTGPYSAPAYKTLTTATKTLHILLNDYLGRFISPSYETLREIGRGRDSQLKQKYLELKEKQSTWRAFFWSNAVNEKRLDQIAQSNLLIQMLPEQETDLEHNSNTLTLLGFYLHRYWRIGSNYTDSFLTPVYKSIGTTEDNSALRLAIESLLKIKTETNQLKGSALDPLTVVTACEAYRDYLQLPANKNKFEYIKNDPDFFKKLQEVIDQARSQVGNMEKQLNYVLFIQSVDANLSSLDNAMNKAIDCLFNSVSENKQKESLSKEGILMILEQISGLPENIKSIIEQLLPPRFRILDNNEIEIPDRGGRAKNNGSLNVYLRNWFENFKKFTLLGAYSMILHDCDKEDMPHLCAALEKSMAITAENQMDNVSRRFALSYLLLFTDDLSTEGLRYSNWSESAALMRRELALQIREVGEKIEADKALEEEANSFDEWTDVPSM